MRDSFRFLVSYRLLGRSVGGFVAKVLNVLASEDDITSPKKGAVLKYGGGLVEDMFKMLPRSTRRVVIRGGNHASAAVSEAFRHRRDSMLMLRTGASATTASRRTTASERSASRTSSPKQRGTSSRSSSASGSAASSGVGLIVRSSRRWVVRCSSYAIGATVVDASG